MTVAQLVESLSHYQPVMILWMIRLNLKKKLEPGHGFET